MIKNIRHLTKTEKRERERDREREWYYFITTEHKRPASRVICDVKKKILLSHDNFSSAEKLNKIIYIGMYTSDFHFDNGCTPINYLCTFVCLSVRHLFVYFYLFNFCPPHLLSIFSVSV